MTLPGKDAVLEAHAQNRAIASLLTSLPDAILDAKFDLGELTLTIAKDEIFGPVLSVIKFKDEDEAVEIANDIAYGLGAGVWTQSLRRAHTIAGRIKAGTVWINTYRAVSFLMPFGGYKASGLGRENGVEAIDGYLQSKSVWINNGPGGANPFILKTAS